MEKLRPLDHFNLTTEKFIVTDMDGRDKAYVTKLVNYINKLAGTLNEEIEARKQLQRLVENTNVASAQKKADAKKILDKVDKEQS